MGWKRGFLSFVLGALFLLAILSGAASFSQAKKGGSQHSSLLLSHLSQIAIKDSFYAALSDAAAASFAASPPPSARPAVRAALYARALFVEHELAGQGYSVSFWCGEASDASLLEASSSMREKGGAALPQGASPLSSPLCAAEFDADLQLRTLHIGALGFCHWQNGAGFGYCARFPSAYKVKF